jgi:hypothetical protein
MKVMIITFVCVFLFILPFNTQSQTVYFEKFLDETEILYSVQQTSDHGYILSGIETDEESDFTVLIRTNETGDSVWTKKFPGICSNSDYKTMAIQTSDGGYALIQSVEESENIDILMIKMDALGNVIWQEQYGDSVDELSWSVAQTNVEGYLLTSNTEEHTYKLIKIDPDGVIEWEREYGPLASFDRRSQAIQSLDEGYLVVALNNLYKLDENGDSLWAKTLETRFNSIKEKDDKSLILAGKNILMKTDSLGNEIWSNEEITLTPNFLTITEDGQYILGEQELLKINEEGEEQWRVELDGTIHALIETADTGFSFCGGDMPSPYDGKGWVIKTDANGFYQSLKLIQPEDASAVWYGQEFLITWRQINVESINILLSLDNGVTWTEISVSYPAAERSYLWQIPFTISDECKIRIVTNDLPELSSENEYPFSILINNSNDYISVNQIKMWFSNDGDGSHNPYTDGGGLLWPGGEESSMSAVFQDGPVFSGKIHDNFYVDGNAYRKGLQAGTILKDGSAANPDSQLYKVWKIRRDWGVFPPGSEMERLEYDYNNWPVEIGAPWIDHNGDGIFDPKIDQPRIFGDETNWMVMNDLDTSRTQDWGGCDPIGVEIQLTVYGYDRQDALADVIFKKYKVINKGEYDIDDFIFGYWSDADLGNAFDDYMGCDTLLDFAYFYNASNADEIYGTPPPAVGYLLLQGQIIEAGKNDSAWFNGEWIEGYKNLPMTSYIGYT